MPAVLFLVYLSGYMLAWILEYKTKSEKGFMTVKDVRDVSIDALPSWLKVIDIWLAYCAKTYNENKDKVMFGKKTDEEPKTEDDER